MTYSDISRSYNEIVRMTEDRETLQEIARQLLSDHRLSMKQKFQPFSAIMNKLEDVRL